MYVYVYIYTSGEKEKYFRHPENYRNYFGKYLLPTVLSLNISSLTSQRIWNSHQSLRVESG